MKPRFFKQTRFRRHLLAGVSLAFLLGPLLLAAQPATPEVSPPRSPTPAVDRLAREELVLERFLELPPERIALMRQSLERLEEMSDAEKAALREKLQQYRELSAQQRRAALQRWKEDRDDVGPRPPPPSGRPGGPPRRGPSVERLKDHLNELPPETQRELLEHLQGLLSRNK